jgi:hypothetical protein
MDHAEDEDSIYGLIFSKGYSVVCCRTNGKSTIYETLRYSQGDI